MTQSPPAGEDRCRPPRRRRWLAGAAALLDWLYPPHCVACGEPLHGAGQRLLCRACDEDLRAARIGGPDDLICDVCGLPLAGGPATDPTDGSPALCTTCRLEQRHFSRARSFVAYREPAVSLIRRYKFRGDYFLGPQLVRLMLARGWMPPGLAAAADCVVPVPLHPRRRLERGYDQAALVARVMARHLQLPLIPRAVARTRYTAQQAMLPVRERWENVRRAFEPRQVGGVRDARVLLVDDVLTTGVTASECARVLRRAGAADVEVLTVARTAP